MEVTEVPARRLPALRTGMAWQFAGRVVDGLQPGGLVRAVESWAPDVVWQQDLVASHWAVRKLRTRAATVLVNSSSEYALLWSNRFGRVALRAMLLAYDLIISPSSASTPPVTSAITIPNGVDVKYFGADRERRRAAARQRLNVAPASYLVLCPARWAPVKGVDVLVAAAQILIGDAPEVVVVYAGDAARYPEYGARVRQAIEESRVRSIVLGDVAPDRMAELYSAADLVVLPSRAEGGTPLALLEAMAAGTPIVASAVGGILDLVRDGVTGHLVEAGDVVALQRALRRAVSGELPRTDGAARELVSATYEWSAIAARYEAALEEARARARERRRTAA